MTNPLTRLAAKYGTDKFGLHNYTPKYHALLSHMRDTPLRMLEIGVGGYRDPNAGGASLQVWRDYFRHSQIVGMDIAKKTLNLGPRIVVEQGSQIDSSFLQNLIAQHGPFDIILDDGSHRNDHVIATYDLLFKTLRPGGFYIVEDVQTAFQPNFGGSLEMTEPNSVRFFAGIMAALIENRPEARDIAQMWRFHNIIAMQKTGGVDLAGPVAARTLRPAEADDAGLSNALAGLQDGDNLAVAGLPDTLLTRFVEFDHREIKAFHPKAQFSDLAMQLSAMWAGRGEVAFEKGQNDYPSNFDFDIEHPEVKAALASYKVMLEDAPSERGLQAYGKIAVKTEWRDGILFAAEMLETLQARESASLKLMIRAAAEADDAASRRRVLAQAVKLYPRNVNFIVQMANTLMSEGDLEGAEKTLLEARAKGADSEDICIQLSRLYLRRKQFDQALAEGKAATQKNAQRPVSWRLLIRAHMALGQQKEAEAACQRAIDCCGNEVLLLISLTEVRLGSADLDGARDALRQAMKIAPEHPQIKRLQARVDAT